ncbi:MAG: peptidoglycan DD-metalloendopeptidase family protein [Chloroflexi bacterium]|nr:peptidoglycan DD-metalloendopeptidase family protein [Chloroflexota bacterium]
MSDQNEETKKANRELVGSVISWVVAIMLSLGLLTMLLWQPQIAKSMQPYNRPTVETVDFAEIESEVNLPVLVDNGTETELTRDQSLYTEGKANARLETIYHTVVSGDSIWALAETYNVEIESILFANYDILQDKSDNLMIGQVIAIPPVDGIYHTWRSRDTLSSVASRYGATIQDILLFIGNNLDLSNPEIEPGTSIMVPGGRRELVPISYAAVTIDAEGRLVSGWDGPGACLLDFVSLYGNGFFIWPSAVHYLTGNNYGPGHNGIDIGAGLGSQLFAADSGTVVYAGWMNGGYGNFVVIDHGNGYSTLYEHLDKIHVSCGDNVFQGSVIGTSGSTGNSTGPHLHFEIRYANMPVNPWDYLP